MSGEETAPQQVPLPKKTPPCRDERGKKTSGEETAPRPVPLPKKAPPCRDERGKKTSGEETASRQALAIYAVMTFMNSIEGGWFPRGGIRAVPEQMALARQRAGVAMAIRYDRAVTTVLILGKLVAQRGASYLPAPSGGTGDLTRAHG